MTAVGNETASGPTGPWEVRERGGLVHAPADGGGGGGRGHTRGTFERNGSSTTCHLLYARYRSHSALEE